MCLASIRRNPSIAREDITVYKVFTSDNRGLFTNFDYSPYINKRFDDTSEERIMYSAGEYLIDLGFIHSCRNIESARILAHIAKDFSHEEIGDCIIRECIIPKGTQFYFRESEIASKSIIIGKVCV